MCVCARAHVFFVFVSMFLRVFCHKQRQTEAREEHTSGFLRSCVRRSTGSTMQKPHPCFHSSTTGNVYARVSVFAALTAVMRSTHALCLSHSLLIPTSLYQTWLYEQEENPYPTRLEKAELSERTEMTIVSPFHVLHFCVLKFSNTKSYLSSVWHYQFSLRNKWHSGSRMHVRKSPLVHDPILYNLNSRSRQGAMPPKREKQWNKGWMNFNSHL